MTDIPLRPLRKHKNRAGYTQLNDTDIEAGPGSADSPDNQTTMPGPITAVASSRKAGKKSRKDRYADDPEEEASLLGGEMYDEEEGYVEETPLREVQKSVCYWHF